MSLNHIEYRTVSLLRPVSLICIAVLLCQSGGESAQITIESSSQYQTIKGMGAYGSQTGWGLTPPYYDQDFLELIANDLQPSIIRTDLPANFELANDNSDPDVMNLEGFNLTEWGDGNYHTPIQNQIDYFNALIEEAESSGREIRIVTSIWSPPGWMKMSGSHRDDHPGTERGDNYLLPEMYDEFAEYCAAYVTIMQNNGIPIYALSPQNEPAFVEPYASCVYTPSELSDIIERIGRRFEQEGITTLIMTPEDVNSFYRTKGYVDGVMGGGAASAAYTDVLAVHGYGGDGITAAAQNWGQVRSLADSYGLPIWMTETSGYNDGWNADKGAMVLANNILAALKFGQIEAWIWWRLSWPYLGDDYKTGESIILANVPTKRYYIHKHFLPFIRPGAVHVGSNSSDTDIEVVAFENDTTKQKTMILINNSYSAKEVSLVGFDPYQSTVERYVSTQTKDCLQETDIDSGSVFTIEARSVTTLFSEYVSTSVKPKRHNIIRNKATRRGSRYLLNGSQVYVHMNHSTQGTNVFVNKYGTIVDGVSPY